MIISFYSFLLFISFFFSAFKFPFSLSRMYEFESMKGKFDIGEKGILRFLLGFPVEA